MRFFLIILLTVLECQYCLAANLYVESSPDSYEKLSQIEKQIYSRDYSQENFSVRIERLENSIFGSTSPEPLLNRLNRLDNAVKKSKAQNSAINHQVILDMIENRYFGTGYPEENMEERLTRLEKSIFGSPCDGNIETRFNNLTQKIPLSIIGISVSANSDSKTSIVPKFKNYKQFLVPPVLKYDKTKGDYYQNIARNSDGKILRWNQFPVRIFIRTEDKNGVQTLEKAVKIWKKYVPLKIVHTEYDADIIIIDDKVRNNITEPALFYLNDEITCKIIIHKGSFADSENFERFLTHEIGHALGIWGHSENSDDIMYEFSELKNDISYKNKFVPHDVSLYLAPLQPSNQDINTLTRIYRTPNSLDDVKNTGF
ncbi:MAG: hypothetical protein PHC34_11255 [Candidatus Gastranaerophilales bacterium]|nr:hypothetical protein [Candidatus Gastranaerophilales bacterium]